MTIAKITPAQGVECIVSSINFVTSECNGFVLFIVLLVVWAQILLDFQIFRVQVKKIVL